MRPDGANPPQRHVLVVERDMIVGIGLAEDLTELGYRVSGPFMNASDAIRLLDSDPPEVAILEIGLRDGTGTEIARALQARSVPFVIFSGGSRRRYVDGEFRDVPWVEKPASTDEVLRALSSEGQAITRPKPA